MHKDDEHYRNMTKLLSLRVLAENPPCECDGNRRGMKDDGSMCPYCGPKWILECIHEMQSRGQA